MLRGGRKKKLQDAARHWLRGRKRGADELLDDLLAFGVDPGQFDDALCNHDENDDGFPVLHCNWAAVTTFLGVQTQWRVGMNGIIGLDYTAVESAVKLQARRLPPRVFEGIQVIEAAVLAALAEQRADA